MTKSRKGKVIADVHRPRRKQEPADRAVEELTWLARIPQESPDPVLRVSAEHVLLYSNPAGQELCRGWGCRLGQKVPAAIRALISAALAEGTVVRQTVAFASRTYGLTVAPSVADGYVHIYARDITDCRRAQEALCRAERRFQAIFDNTSDGIFLLDLETRKFTMCNNACSRMLGYTQDEFVNLSIPDLHLQADVPFIQAQIDEFLEGRRGTRHDIRFKRRDGSLVFTDLSPDLVLLDGKRYIVVALKDVTERKRAEEALQSERDQAQQYLQVAGVMMVALDAEGRITLINERGCEILGYQQEEILGQDWFDVCLPREVREEVTGVFHRLLAGDIAPVEYCVNPVLRKDGQPRLVAFHNTVLRDASSRIVGVLSSGEDITEHRRTEEALTASERKYHSLVENIPDVTWTTDRQGRTLFISSNVREIYGYSAEEIYAGGNTWLGNVHPDDRARIEKSFDELFTRKKPFDVEYRIRRKDGNWIWLHDRSVATYEREGQWYADGLFSDITERKHMEEELQRHTEHLEELVAARTREVQESERRYRGLVEKINDWVWEVDADGVYTYVSPRARELLGYTPEEIVGKTPFDLMPPAEAQRVRDAFRSTWLERKPLEQLENTLVRKDGALVTVETSGMPMFAEDGAFLGYTGIDRDVTSRKQAQEALREKEYLLSESQRIGHIGTWSADPATGTGVWTPEMYRLFGVSPDTFVPTADAFVDLLHPEDRDAMREWIRGALAGEQPGGLEFRVPLPDGSVRVLIGRGEAIWADGHRPVRLVGTAQDVTQRVQAQESLRFTQFAVDHTADAAFWMTEEGRFFYVNEAACRALGYSCEELLQMTVYDIDPAFTESMWRESWRRLKGQKSIVLETVHRAKDGHVYPVEIRANYLEFGGREYDCAFARDITERKRAEEALRGSEARFRTAFEEGAVAMALTALDSTLLKVNSAFCRMLGFPESQLVGRSHTEITHPDDRAANLVGIRRLASGEISSFRMEKRYVRKDGAVVWGDMNTASVRDGQGRPLYCVTHVQDITERRQAEEALRELNEQLELQVAQRTEELHRTIDRLQQLTLELSQAEDRERKRIADILHDDVQQTLAAARFHLNLLGTETRGAEENQEIVEQVKQMLKDAIEKSRRLSHELSPALYQVDLTAILEWLARHMQEKHGLTVHVEAHGPVDSPSEPLKAFLYKVVQELLFNVVKHAGVGEARIRVRRMGQWVYLSVADRGRGFEPQKLERATGFGLLGIRERVQLLGGRMKIQSSPGLGSRFLIAVPDEAPRGLDGGFP